MKKIILILGVLLIATVGYSINNQTLKDKEIGIFNYSGSDIMRDYEDIIIKKGNNDQKVVALTFDDGPDEVYTPQILDILKKYDVKATFFLVGENIERNSDIVAREVEEGHEIGNHTYTHINVAKNGYNEIYNEIIKTQDIIKK